MRTLSAGRSPHVRRQRCHRVHLRMRMLDCMIDVHTYMYMGTCARVVEHIVQCGLYDIPHTGDAIAAPIVCIISHRCTRIYTPCPRTVYICVHACRDIATPASMSGPPASGVVGGVYCSRAAYRYALPRISPPSNMLMSFSVLTRHVGVPHDNCAAIAARQYSYGRRCESIPELR